MENSAWWQTGLKTLIFAASEKSPHILINIRINMATYTQFFALNWSSRGFMSQTPAHRDISFRDIFSEFSWYFVAVGIFDRFVR